MAKAAVLTILLVLFGAVAAQASPAEATVETLVAQCKHEAVRAHQRAWRLEPSLRTMIEAHRDLMATACVRWLTTERTEVLLTQCLEQASNGPQHIQRGRNMDRPYVARQQELCRKIAATRTQRLVELKP